MTTIGDAADVEPLVVAFSSPLLLLSREPIASLPELAGMKVRVTGSTAIYTGMMRTFGASPIQTSLGEAIGAIQNNAIDGMVAGLHDPHLA